MFSFGSLNPQQREAVQTLRGPVLILAGAGTGKTRVITCRIAHLIQSHVAPDHILAVTFTNKAAREMKERVREMVPRHEGATLPTISTFHSLCVRILRRYIERLGYKENFTIYDDTEQLGVVKKVLSHINGEKVDPKEVLMVLSRYKNGQLKPGSDVDEKAIALADHIKGRYQQALRACNAVDFDDLLLLTLELFEKHEDVLEECRIKYRFVMVDEYQDTNAAQFRLVNLLTEKHRNLCVVGDDDQSIYGWRGAEVANLLDLERFYPEVKVIKLEQNYRSTNVILEAANAVIKNNPRRRVKNLWSENGVGEKIILNAYDDEEAEAREVVEQIQLGQMRGGALHHHAILFRTNLQSRPLETALRQAGIRYHLIGGQSFFDRREIKDVLAYLKMLCNPDDEISLLRIANIPARGLSDTTMERLLAASQERGQTVYQVMRHTDVRASFLMRIRESIQDFHQLVEHHRALLQADPNLNLATWARAFFAEIGYADELRRSEKNQEVAENRVMNMMALIDSLEKAGRGETAQKRLTTYLEEVMLDSDREAEKEEAKDAVTLITMHSCKGLEFPHVFIVGLEDGLLPHTRSKLEGTMDEERRLFYVGITRAKITLTISHCGGRRKYGQVLPCHPSPFLKELPDHLVELEDPAAKKPVAVDSGKSMFERLRATIG